MENKQDKGFTLVELLIVIVILGILATVTVFAVRGITDRGQDNACSVDERTLSTGIEAFYAQQQRDPVDLTELSVGAYVTPLAVPPVRAANPQPVLKEAPTSFRFVAASIAPAFDYPANSWNNPTPAIVAAPTIPSAQFVPTTGGSCAS